MNQNTTPRDTMAEFDAVIAECRSMYSRKLQDYGASWRVMRQPSITDQLFIKAKRIRSLQIKGTSLVGDGVLPEFQSLVNYGVIALIQAELGAADHADIDQQTALQLYDRIIGDSRALMQRKNHDYDEAWRDMRQCSFADIILTKLNRIKEIEGNGGQVIVSEGVESNYQDIINYAVFALILIAEGQND